MVGFSPAQYGEKLVGESETEKSSLHKNTNRLVKKGGNDILKIDINEIESISRNLRRNSHLLVKTLPPDVKRDFRQLLTYVSLLHGSSQYVILHDIVMKHFSNIGEIYPGTIGAYCSGCQVETSFNEGFQGCSAICAGSMPPKKDNWNFCENTVILATYEEDRYIFTISQRSETIEGRETAFVFVNCTCVEDFPGFSTDEKNQLRALGIKSVYLNGCTKDGRKYPRLEDSVTSLDDIKLREHEIIDNNPNFNDSGIVVFLIILGLIALFFAWRYWQLNGQKRT